MTKKSKKKNAQKGAEAPKSEPNQAGGAETPVISESGPEVPENTPEKSTQIQPQSDEVDVLKKTLDENKHLLEQNDKAKKIVKAQKEKCKKIEAELEAQKVKNDEWEGVTKKLQSELDALTEREQNLLSQNAELTAKLDENDPKELTEKLTDKSNEVVLVREQLEAREGQLTALQTRLSELEHENEMMSDRDDQEKVHKLSKIVLTLQSL